MAKKWTIQELCTMILMLIVRAIVAILGTLFYVRLNLIQRYYSEPHYIYTLFQISKMVRRKLIKRVGSNAVENEAESTSDDSVSSGFLAAPRPDVEVSHAVGENEMEEHRNENDSITQAGEDEVRVQAAEANRGSKKAHPYDNDKQVTRSRQLIKKRRELRFY